MQVLNLPTYQFKIITEGPIKKIFDPSRQKYVKLTPEEWVRQNMVTYLIQEKGYPNKLIANEVEIKINDMSKRCDTVIYDRQGQPKIIVEYKAPHIKISQKTFDQIALYKYKLRVEYLIVSNGLNHYCCKVDLENSQYVFLEDIPKCFF